MSVGASSIVVSGAIASGGRAMVQAKAAGGSSTSPNRLVDWTSKVWPSNVRSMNDVGEVQGVKAAPSSEQAKLTPVDWSAAKVKVAPVAVVVAGSAGTSAVIDVSAGPT